MTVSGTLACMNDGSGAKRIAIVNDIEPGDWQDVFEVFQIRTERFSSFGFNAAVGIGTLSGLFGVVALFVSILGVFFPFVPQTYLACFVLPPGLLAGIAAGQGAGNAYMRLWFGINQATRRGFATRLTLARAPEGWPEVVTKWLFTGNWLKTPDYDARLPYVRVFVSGNAPKSCAEEDALWREIHSRVSGDGLWEAEANHRELSYPTTLPGWARLIEPGDGVHQLDIRLGRETSRQWLEHLWRRACRQWPLFGGGDYPVDARRECFEAHHLHLQGGREALMVVLRPSCFAAEVYEATLEEVDGIAA